MPRFLPEDRLMPTARPDDVIEVEEGPMGRVTRTNWSLVARFIVARKNQRKNAIEYGPYAEAI